MGCLSGCCKVVGNVGCLATDTPNAAKNTRNARIQGIITSVLMVLALATAAFGIVGVVGKASAVATGLQNHGLWVAVAGIAATALGLLLIAGYQCYKSRQEKVTPAPQQQNGDQPVEA